MTFSLNHTFLPVTAEPTHWLEYSHIHIANFELAPWCDWAMGYLNYQIGHHLFLSMPNFRLPFIKDRVKALAAEHNIPYILHSYPEAVSKVFIKYVTSIQGGKQIFSKWGVGLTLV